MTADLKFNSFEKLFPLPFNCITPLQTFLASWVTLLVISSKLYPFALCFSICYNGILVKSTWKEPKLMTDIELLDSPTHDKRRELSLNCGESPWANLMIAAIRSFQGNYAKLKLSVGKRQQKQKSVYFNELRSVSPVPLTLHWGSFRVHTVHCKSMMDAVMIH